MIGYGLAAPYRGHGYGTELVRALSRWLLRQPGVRHVVAQVEPDNAASRATLRRTGFAADGPDRYRRNRAPASRSVDSGPPRLIADERETLLAFVAYLRERVIAKCAGLSDVDARRSAVGSGTSLLWLVKHVTAVEIFWLWHAFAGRDRDVIPDPELTVDDTVESTVAAYRAIVLQLDRPTGPDDATTEPRGACDPATVHASRRYRTRWSATPDARWPSAHCSRSD